MGSTLVLCRERRKGICINSVSRHRQENGFFKADPFANYAERRPGTASRVTDISNLKWSDEQWLQKRKKWDQKGESAGDL